MAKKLLAGAAAVVGLSIAMLGGVTAGASAAPAAAPISAAVTCTGAGCDNKDPYDSGCGASRVNAGQKATVKGTFILYYSSTCKTNWIEVPSYAGGSTRTDGKLELAAWDKGRGKFLRFLASSSAGRHYGNMVYSPGDSCAVGLGDWNGGSTWEVAIESSGC
ncbi:DUF2690 domain-containing protein [Lentzea sp. BCCO 10_0798]|uniref:DUF2690 domain-containing protein n=1 Tax=Lentzea kristufekii TaxID=3095430 RepID=A0ABU4TUS6_9PSEU|nr:DUF2690 domain-containing protein [Lentzea sp. BCCO 10_0798]MDX8052031.1 DUF2690 domain-containing protein [Lentzea sp. BCCO 10_0798]